MGLMGGLSDASLVNAAESSTCGSNADGKHHFTSMIPGEGKKMSCACACGASIPAKGGPGAWRCKTK